MLWYAFGDERHEQLTSYKSRAGLKTRVGLFWKKSKIVLIFSEKNKRFSSSVKKKKFLMASENKIYSLSGPDLHILNIKKVK